MATTDISKIIGSFRQQIIVAGLDITDWVISANCSRSVASPMGQWTLILRPVIGNDNLMLRIPADLNDLVELRVDRNNSGPVQVVMRGVLGAEDMSEKPSTGLDGSPNRSYMLSGNDLGKILERKQLFYPPDSSEESIIQRNNVGLTIYDEIIKYADQLPDSGDEGEIVIELSAWVKYFVSVVYTGELAQSIEKSRGSQFGKFSFIINEDLPKIASGKDRFQVAVKVVNNLSGSYWTFIKYYCIFPFIETFFEDRNDSTVFHVRWTPLRMRVADGQGFKYFFPSQLSSGRPWRTQDIKQITLTTKDILEKQIRRQDTDRCTYFFVSLNTFSNGSNQTVQYDEQDGGNTIGNNPYWDKEGEQQFGLRPMVIEIPWLNTEQEVATSASPTTGPINQPTADVNPPKWTYDIKNILNDLNAWLVQTMTYTDQLYTGSLTIIGNSNITVGCEVYVADSQELYYVESVEHSWQSFPNPQFITRLGISRGVVMKPFTASEKNRFIRVGTGGTNTSRAKLGLLAPAGGDSETADSVNAETGQPGTRPNPYGLSVPPSAQ